MLARSTKLIHKQTGSILETPLLIPSFSSKGFVKAKKGKSEIGDILQYASEFLTRTCLVSAYDVHYGHIPSPLDLPVTPEIIFIDSGGYEVSWDHDYSAVVKSNPNSNTWSQEMHQKVLDEWPEEIPAVLVSYDHPLHRKPLLSQIKEARGLFRKHPNHLHLFLLKPSTTGQTTLMTVLRELLANIEELSPFDILGVTEKELGSSMLDRMLNIANLRKAMDDAGLEIKIHVFGALDPLTVGLYFISGAEIFDGLTWIRYAYNDGCCVYPHNHGALKYGLHVKDNQVKLRSMTDNIYSLENLEHRLREFLSTQDYDKFSPHHGIIQNA